MNADERQLATWEGLRSEARLTDQLLDAQLRKLEDVALFDDAKLTEKALSIPERQGSSGSTSPPLNAAVPGSSPGLMRRSASGTSSSMTALTSLEEVESQYQNASREIDEAVRRLEQTVTNMEEVCRTLSPSSAAARHTERFRGVLLEKQQTRRRLATEFQRRKDRYELTRSSHGGQQRRRGVDMDDDRSGGVRILMEEQASIHHTLNRVNGLLEQADGTRDRLRMQRERFDAMGDKLLHIAERIPIVQNVLQRINARRRREVVVLGTVLACLTFIFFFLF